MSRYIIALLLLSFIVPELPGQQNNIPVTYEGGEISGSEFRKRFELTPRVRTTTNIDSQKVQFLLSLAAEKLWAREAYYQNLDTLYAFRQYIKNLEKLLVRDELFSRVVLDSVKVTPGEIQEAVERRALTLSVNFLFSPDKEEIGQLYKQLQNGASFDSILSGRPEAGEQTEPVKVTFGQMNEEQENVLYSLDTGEYSEPVYDNIGWVIYYLKEKLPNKEMLTNELLREIKSTLQDRQKKKLMEEYQAGILKGEKVYTDRELFILLSDKLARALSENYSETDSKVYYLYEDDFDRLLLNLPEETLSKNFVKFENDPVSLREFIYYLSFNNFKTPEIKKDRIAAELNAVIREFIRLEIITREGYKKGYDQLPSVKEELEMWKDNYLSQLLKNSSNSEARVSASEIDRYLAANKDTSFTRKLVTADIVNVKTLDEVEKLINETASGKNLSGAAAKYGFDITSEINKPLSEYGSLTEIIDGMKQGEVYGPLKKEKGYILIEVKKIEEKEIDPTLEAETKREIASQKLFYDNLKKILDEKTIRYAEKYNLRIDTEAIEDIKVTEVTTFIYRLYGFGGQSAASPFLNLYYDWYYKWKSEDKITF